ncbi:hypothetical protein PIB30_072933 [Stylosanthes scabra]|uniref:GRF-type domain-containing protein n=1 Tax=Stylosanthes scabra TaxID=79078 RepID=A0ABU6XRS1_9FABA|nr:hypothetical protein [Stylosanthes scabra]
MIDASSGGALMNKTLEEAWELIETVAMPTNILTKGPLVRVCMRLHHLKGQTFPSSCCHGFITLCGNLLMPDRVSASVLLPQLFAPLRLGEWVSAHSMATRCRKSSNESTGSGDSASVGDRVCHCGLKAPLKVSHSYANPGREYYSCPAMRCKWFKWAGPSIKGASSIGPQTNE